ncbi:uncharacterized protein LOC124837011 isoform X2 [Vigna umbellata]|uniref:Uncharacterized protein LOC106769309 isoform X2 n=1 Tax=Vigna radiata var. radiata TaxID=3916 RepID=A0A3Q0F654_VIGRR|nr:uncharacterized protein LOC106769309 isoform X2 [Vigna radiata var. radiata]XP_047168248.1 uncharacterized protein LOC124837011 isoform X2 [Vigna umbellata]
MSGGTPRGGGGFMRQRHSQGYSSSGDDLEDDACSRHRHFLAPSPSPKTWIEMLENFLWLASAAFILYFGDQKSNMIHLLCHDSRIRRLPLYLGMIGIGLNTIIFIYTTFLAWSARRFDEKWGFKKWEITTLSVLPFVTVLLCFVANMEFFDTSSSVYTIYGMHGSNPLPHYWDTAA